MENNPKNRTGDLLPRNFWASVWWVSIALIALFRLFIVSQDEVVPTNNDARNYAIQANYYLQSSQYSCLPKQPPGLSMFACASKTVGMPYKVSLDLFLILMALVCSALVAQITSSRICGLIVFGLVTLNPWFIARSKLFMSEPLTAVLLICLLASSVQFLFYPVRKWTLPGAILAGIVSASYILTRSEMPLLLLFWILVAVGALVLNWKSFRRLPISIGRYRILLIMIPLLTTMATTQIVKTVHYRHYGVRAITQTEATGFKNLINALYSIPPDEEIRFSPVTLQSMEVACDTSPTLDKYRKRLLNKNAPAFKSTKKNLGLDNQVGTWLNWHLVGTFRGVNKQSNGEMRQAAAELELAQREGRLKKRFGAFPIDPLWNQWLPEVPSAWCSRILRSIHANVYSQTNGKQFSSIKTRNIVDIGLFDTGLLRRMSVGNTTVVKVFATTGRSGFRRVRILSSTGRTIGETRMQRFGNQIEFSFTLPDSTLPEDVEPKTIEFFRHRDEKVKPVQIQLRSDWSRKKIDLEIPNQEAEHWIISVSTTVGKTGEQQWLKLFVAESFYLVFWVLIACAFLVGSIRGIKPQRLRRIFWFAGIGIAFLLARTLFYTLVEVWLNWGEFRYVEPNSLFTTLVFVCTAFAAGAWLNRRVSFLRNNRFSRCHPRPSPL